VQRSRSSKWRSLIRISTLDDIDSYAKWLSEFETVVFWGAGRKVPRLLHELCGEEGVLNSPQFITDSTRPLNDYEFGIPSLPFELLPTLAVESTLIVISAGLMDLQARVVRNSLYYHRIIDHTALEHVVYLKKHAAEAKVAAELFRGNDSRRAFDELLLRRANGVVWSPDLFSPNAYFGNHFVADLPNDGDVYFAGAFNGNHIERMRRTNPATRIIAFEPSTKWSEITRNRFASDSLISVEQGILGSKPGSKYLYEDVPNDGLAATVYETDSEEEPRTEVRSVVIDEHADDRRVSQIILDVEGAEEDVLWGAQTQIRRHQPVLTICSYHSPEQFVELPLAIERVAPGVYDLELLHHSCVTPIETVIYALPKRYER
jgi:FkbM family methyltransferase